MPSTQHKKRIRGDFMKQVVFQAPFDDDAMTYDFDKHRYILEDDYVRSQGIDLGLILDTEHAPEPSRVEEIVRDRVSLLVYENIYQHGRSREQKQYLLACNPNYRNIIRDAMVERLRYMVDSGDLSTRSGALVSQGTRVEVRDLLPSVVEEMMLKGSGLLHRGEYSFIKDETLVY